MLKQENKINLIVGLVAFVGGIICTLIVVYIDLHKQKKDELKENVRVFSKFSTNYRVLHDLLYHKGSKEDIRKAYIGMSETALLLLGSNAYGNKEKLIIVDVMSKTGFVCENLTSIIEDVPKGRDLYKAKLLQGDNQIEYPFFQKNISEIDTLIAELTLSMMKESVKPSFP